MSVEVLFPLAFLGAISYAGVFMLSRPSEAIEKVMAYFRRMDEWEAVLTQQPLCEPIEVDNGPRSQAIMRIFGLAVVAGALVQAAMRLNAL